MNRTSSTAQVQSMAKYRALTGEAFARGDWSKLTKEELSVFKYHQIDKPTFDRWKLAVTEDPMTISGYKTFGLDDTKLSQKDRMAYYGFLHTVGDQTVVNPGIHWETMLSQTAGNLDTAGPIGKLYGKELKSTLTHLKTFMAWMTWQKGMINPVHPLRDSELGKQHIPLIGGQALKNGFVYLYLKYLIGGGIYGWATGTDVPLNPLEFFMEDPVRRTTGALAAGLPFVGPLSI